MSDNPLADMVNSVNRIVTPHLEAIGKNINDKLDRRLKRQQLEEKVIVDHSRLRLQEQNYEARLQSAARQQDFYEQKVNQDLDLDRRKHEAAVLEDLTKSTDDQIAILEARRVVAEIDGQGLEQIDAELGSLKAKKAEYFSRMQSTIAPTQYDRIEPTAQQSTQLNMELPRKDAAGLGFESYENNELFRRTPADNGVISQKANAWEGQNFKKGEYARCADFVCSVLEESGVKLDDKRSDLVYALNNDKFGEYVPPGEFMAGDVVILRDTYDAEHGYEETHTGIYEERNGRPGMIHRPTRSKEVMWSPIDKDSDYAGKVMNGRRVRPPQPEQFFGPSEDAPFESNITVYSPQTGGDRVQGGLKSAKPGPDGVNQVRTIDDVFNGRSSYVTLAGNPSLYGKEYIVKNVQYQPEGPDGPTYTIPEVRGVVHDTGSAFSDAPEGRFDIPIAANVNQEVRNRHHDLFKKAGVSFEPVSNTEQLRATPIAAEVTATPMPPSNKYEVLEADDQTTYSFDDPDSDEGPLVIDDLVAETGATGVLAASPNTGVGIIKNEQPERKKLTANELKERYRKIQAIPDPKLREQALSMVSGKIREVSPDIFDEEIEAIAQDYYESGSRTDFEKALPEEIVATVGLDRAVPIFQRGSTQYKVEQKRIKDFDEKSTRLKQVQKDLDDAELSLIRARNKTDGKPIPDEINKYQAIVDRYKAERDTLSNELDGLRPHQATDAAGQTTTEPETKEPLNEDDKNFIKRTAIEEKPKNLILIDSIANKLGVSKDYLDPSVFPDKPYGFIEKYADYLLPTNIDKAVNNAMIANVKQEADEFLKLNDKDRELQSSAVTTFLGDPNNIEKITAYIIDNNFEAPFSLSGKLTDYRKISPESQGTYNENIDGLIAKDRAAIMSRPEYAAAIIKSFLKKDLRENIRSAIITEAEKIDQEEKAEAISVLTNNSIQQDL